MTNEKSARSSDIRKIMGQIQKQLTDLDIELQQISVNGIPRDNTMIEGPSMMFEEEEIAKMALENPDLEFGIQYIKDIVKKHIK